MPERDTSSTRNLPVEDRRVTPELHRKLQFARELCAAIKRALTVFRLYAEGHENIRDVDQELQRRAQAVLAQTGELELFVRPDGFMLEGRHPVAVEETAQESPAWPMYVDGVERVVFSAGMPLQELPVFCRMLRAAQDGLLPRDQSLSTQIWEHNFRGIRVVLVDLFAESRNGQDAAEAGLDKERIALTQYMDWMSMPSLLRPLPNPQVNRLPVLTPLEIGALQVEVLPDLGPADLMWVDAGTLPPVAPLNSDERWFMANGLSQARSKAVGGMIPVLWMMMQVGSRVEQAEVLQRVAAMLGHMLRGGMQRELGLALRKVMELAKTHRANLQLLEEFMCTLTGPTVLPVLARDLEDRSLSTVAGALLKFIPVSGAMALLDLLPSLKSADACTSVVTILCNRRIPEAALLERMQKWNPALVPQLMQIATSLPPESMERMLLAGLGHGNALMRLATARYLGNMAQAARMAATRAQGMRIMSVEDAREEMFTISLPVRRQLLRMVHDHDAQVRQAVLDIFVRTKDPEVVPSLISLVDKDIFPLEERRGAIRTICSLGGRSTFSMLRRVVQTETMDPMLRADAAQALGTLKDDEARSILLAISGKFFVNRVLKEACVDALKKLDARRTPGA